MMMTQPFPVHAGMAPGHPGIPQHHPMAIAQQQQQQQHPGVPHMGGQPGPGMMQGMHPGVSGPQVNGPMVTGMPPGAGTVAPGGPVQNAHAMAHLGPQPQMFQQHHPQMNMAGNPQMMQQNQMLARQRQDMMLRQHAAQHGAVPVTMPGGQGFNAQQMAAMRAQGMNIPMQLHQLQQAAANQQQSHNMQQHQHQQQMIAAQQQAAVMRAQQQQQQQNNAHQMQMSHSQEPVPQPPQPQPTPAPQATPQPQQQQSTPQPTPQQLPAQQQGQSQTGQQPQQNQTLQQQREQQLSQQEAQQRASAMMMQQRGSEKKIVGLSILRLVQYQDHLGSPGRQDDLDYWESFVEKFFSPEGVLRQQLFNTNTGSDKKYQIQYPSLARFYQAHFTGGIKQILMSVVGAVEKDLDNGRHTVYSNSSGFTYVYDNDIRIVTSGILRAHFDEENKIEYLDIATTKWVEYIPRSILPQSESPDMKQSPKANKNLKRAQQKPTSANSGVLVPSAMVNEYGTPRGLVQFLEMAEIFSAMTPLIQYSQSHPTITPQEAMRRMVAENAMRAQTPIAGLPQGNLHPAMQQGVSGQRTPGMNGPNQFASPALAHLGLPTNQGSPHIGGAVHTPSPAQTHMAGPVAMVHQQSQQGSNLSGSQGTSANTSPNVTNKRRRASAVKMEEDAGGPDVNGAGASKVKPSPRLGGKRAKGTA